MGSARGLLLAAALAFAIAADARTDATLSTLTLSPDTNSLITTRDESTTTGTSSSTTAIGSAASDTHKVTKAPVTESPATTAPSTTAPSTTAPPTSSESDAASASDSGEQDTTDAPSSASATVSPGSTSDRSYLDSESQKDATSTSTSTSTASKSTTASVDTLNSSGDGLSSGSSSSMGTTLPVVFGALACVGAIVMAVTYKKKRNSNGADSEGSRPGSDCEYTGGADFTPDNRALSIVLEDTAPRAVKISGLGPQSSADVRASAAIADFTGTGSSVCSSPFSTSRGKARVSSPVQSGYSSSEANMEFQDTGLRHDGGSNVVLTFDEVPTDSSHAAPQVQL